MTTETQNDTQYLCTVCGRIGSVGRCCGLETRIPVSDCLPASCSASLSHQKTMKTIYKYPIEITDSQVIKMPINAEMIHAGLDPQGAPCVWATVDSQNAAEAVTVFVVGTGNPIPERALRHVGSFNQGPFVWHLFIA